MINKKSTFCKDCADREGCIYRREKECAYYQEYRKLNPKRKRVLYDWSKCDQTLLNLYGRKSMPKVLNIIRKVKGFETVSLRALWYRLEKLKGVINGRETKKRN